MKYPHQSFKLLALGALVALTGARAQAQEATEAPSQEAVEAGDIGTKFKIDPADPAASVPTTEQAMKNPLEMGYMVMDLLARAEAARQRKDHAKEASYYRAIVKAVPERAIGYSKLCAAYEDQGDRAPALEACKTALGKGGVTVDDYVHYAALTLAGSGELKQAEIEDVEAVLTHLREQAPKDQDTRLRIATVQCQLGARLADVVRLRGCTSELNTLAAKDPRTATFGFALALAEDDLKKAHAIAKNARAQGLPAPLVLHMQEQLVARESAASSLPASWLESPWLIACVVLLVALAANAVLALRRRLRAVS